MVARLAAKLGSSPARTRSTADAVADDYSHWSVAGLVYSASCTRLLTHRRHYSSTTTTTIATICCRRVSVGKISNVRRVSSFLLFLFPSLYFSICNLFHPCRDIP